MRQHEALAPIVNGVRQQIGDALGRHEYAALVALRARLVAALEPEDA